MQAGRVGTPTSSGGLVFCISAGQRQFFGLRRPPLGASMPRVRPDGFVGRLGRRAKLLQPARDATVAALDRAGVVAGGDAGHA